MPPGIDRKELATNLLQSFLRHAIRDGFFHADMHPGNLFADPRTGGIIAVDFGIMGRISRRERRFLADILYGFITRNYRMIAERHFEIGYVPRTSRSTTSRWRCAPSASRCRAARARDISMAKVLGQLFATTELFDMQTRPELVLLQKSMVLVEGVCRARSIPSSTSGRVSEPVVGDWVRREAGPLGRLEDLKEQPDTAVDTAVGRLPAIIDKAEAALDDYDADKRSPKRRFNRFMVVAGFWLLAIVCALLIWRLWG